MRGYCGPDAYKPVGAEAVSQSRRRPLRGRHGARRSRSIATDKAMGVAVLDYNQDGWPDLFVGSDRVPAKLYRNDGQGRFVDEAVGAGVALSENGAARANMGVDAARLRSLRPPASARRQLPERDARPVSQRRTAGCSTTRRRARTSAAPACSRSPGRSSSSMRISTAFPTSSRSTAAPTNRRRWTPARD